MTLTRESIERGDATHEQILALIADRNAALRRAEAAGARAAQLRIVVDELTDAIDAVDSEPGRDGPPVFNVDWLRALKALRDTTDVAKWLAERDAAVREELKAEVLQLDEDERREHDAQVRSATLLEVDRALAGSIVMVEDRKIVAAVVASMQTVASLAKKGAAP